MRSSRVLAGVCVLALAASACSNERSTATTGSIGDTTATSSTLAGTTSSSSSSTSSSTTTSSSTSTSTSSTTTTIAAVKGLALSESGLGDALFGADADGVIAYVQHIAGAPTVDSGWTTPAAAGGACPGTNIRFVAWNDLALFFTDDSPFATGIRHFAEYRYGPASGVHMVPYGLATASGIGIGSTVAQLKAAYPTVVVNPSSAISGPTFVITAGFQGFLSGTRATDTITSFLGGFGCGE